MKKIICAVLLFAMALSFCACGCNHQWQDATCTAPKTCTACGETEGSPAGHSWADATCAAPKTCTVCSVTEGNTLAHTWADATCDAPKTCTVCTATEGEALVHTWVDATCDAPKTCSTCTATEGEALPHDLMLQEFTESTRTDSCTICGEIVTSDVEDLAQAAMDLLSGSWEAKELYNGIEVTPLSETFAFEFTADGSVVSNLPENPGTGVVTFDHFMEFMGMFRYVAEVNGVTYDIAYQAGAPNEFQWWYRNRYAAIICHRQ